MAFLHRVVVSAWTVTILLVMLVLSITLQAWGLQPFGSGVDYARAGTWGTIVSGLASAIAVTVAVGNLAAEQKRNREELARTRSNEITQVYAWLEPRSASDGGSVWMLNFENATRVPTYEWSVELKGDTSLTFDSSDYGPIRPGASTLKLRVEDEIDRTSEPRVSLQFVDADGVNWLRSPAGALQKK